MSVEEKDCDTTPPKPGPTSEPEATNLLKKDAEIPPLEPEMSSQESNIFIEKMEKKMTSQRLFNQSTQQIDLILPIPFLGISKQILFQDSRETC